MRLLSLKVPLTYFVNLTVSPKLLVTIVFTIPFPGYVWLCSPSGDFDSFTFEGHGLVR